MGNATEYAYDKNGNLLYVKDPLGNTTRYFYTGGEKLASSVDPLSNTTNYSHDCFGNLLKVTNALGYATTYTYDTANQMHFNKANLLTVADANANAISYSYDPLDRLIKVVDAQNQSTQFSYDNQGNLMSRTDANGKTTSYQYDSLNRLTRVNYPDSTSIAYTYDATSNITQRQDQSGSYSYSFDKVNRLKSETYPDSTALSYNYDSNGNKITLDLTGYGRISYNYDNLNRPYKITSADGKNAQFGYDKVSRRVQITYPNGTSAAFTYDAADRLTNLVNKDKTGQDISRFNYVYDAVSRRTHVDLINGGINYSYDKISQLISEFSSIGGKNTSVGYSYGPAGNRAALNEDGRVTNYTYNNLNQLITEKGGTQKLIQVKGNVSDANPVTVKVNNIPAIISGGQFTAYDVGVLPGANKIRAEAVDSAGNIGVNEINVTYTPNAQNLSFVYDKNGNLTQRNLNGAAENLSYDPENRLKAYTASGQNVSYAYNGQGRRISKTVNGTTTKYYWDGDEIIAEKTGGSATYYIHGPRIDEILWDSRGYNYDSDGLGSVVNLTDSAGTKANSYDYKSFGQLRSQSGSTSNPWLFTGRQFDSESGLYYYRNRYYDSRSGRFITRDPIGISGGINLYIYALNNPVINADPFGLDAIVLNDPNGAFGFGHNAIAIGDDNRGWDYFSQDGTTNGGGQYEHYDSFIDMRAENSRYTDYHRISSSLEQDSRMTASAINNLDNPYSANPLNPNRYHCADLVSDSLIAGNIPVGKEPPGNSPNLAFKNISRANPTPKKENKGK